MKPTILAVHIAAFLAIATPASAETYRMINREKPTEIMLVRCVQTPRNPTLNWIRRNCTPVNPQNAGTGRIVDVLYSAAGNTSGYR